MVKYLGFKGDIRQAGAGAANKWFYDVWDSEAGLWDVAPGKDPEHCPVLYTSFPSLKDPHHDPGPEQHHTGEIVTFVPYDMFTKWLDQPWRNRDEAFYDAAVSLLESGGAAGRSRSVRAPVHKPRPT